MGSSTEPLPLNIAIIGGGFAGLAVQIGLQKYPHINAHVYEAADKFSELGAGAGIGPNAQRAMAIIDDRIVKGFESRTDFSEGDADKDGLYPWVTMVKGQAPDIDEVIAEYKHKIRGSTIHRAHFLDELAKLVEPDRAHFSKRVVEIREAGDADPIVLHFSDGTTTEVDAVLGADGIHSMVRKYILGPDHLAAEAFFTGAIAWRTVVPIAEAIAKLGDAALDQKFDIKCGKDGMVFGFPMANQTLYYIGIGTFHNPPVPHNNWKLPVDVVDLKRRFADWDDIVRKQIELVPDNKTTVGWSIWEMPPAPTYYKGRIAIIGDAAHASPPFQGAGSGQAIEDACVLEQLFGRVFDPNRKSRNPDPPLTTHQKTTLVLQAFETARRFRSQRVVTSSSEMARLVTGNEEGGPTRAADLRERVKGRLDWIWDEDQERQVKEAYLIFEEAEFAAARKAANLPKTKELPDRTAAQK